MNILNKIFGKPKSEPITPGTLIRHKFEIPWCHEEYLMYIETKSENLGFTTKHWFLHKDGSLSYIKDTNKQFFIKNCPWLERVDV